MKCHYYLSPTLEITSTVSDDLNNVGVSDWYIHVISKDEAGLKKKKIHSGNYIEKSDAFAGSLTGAIIGALLGALAALILYVSPAGENLSGIVYFLVIFFPAGFGLWEGALLRAKYASKKIEPFLDDIEAGKNLILIYAPKDKGSAIQDMMREKHPGVEHVSVDEHFMNPYTRSRQT